MNSQTKLVLAVSICAFAAFAATAFFYSYAMSMFREPLQIVLAKTYYTAGLIVGLSALAGAMGAAWLWQKLF